jgi:arylsulfatase A-like enzyme
MTDDMNAAALEVMPNVRRLLVDQGTTFVNSVVSYPLCCPSRGTFLTGQYAHNHGVLGNGPPDGGFAKLRADETLPVWLQRAGYHTVHIGKFLNGYGRQQPTEIPPGWSQWYGSVDPTTYRMWGYTLNENGTLRQYGTVDVEDPATYQTDVYAGKAVAYVKRRAPAAEPFFLSFAPLAPHGEGAPAGLIDERNPRPAPRHRGALEQVTLPRPPSYNEADVADKPASVRNRPLITPQVERRIEDVRLRGRLESLLAVDDAVGDIVAALESAGELDNTHLVFTSDNGWMQGEHRIPAGKVVPYEESIRVPLIIRGPGVPTGKRVSTIAANIDLAPTILDAADAQPALNVDGRSLLPIAAQDDAVARGIVIETGPRERGAWYTGLRAPRWKYVEHSTGERELYDLRTDPYELTSVHADPAYARTRRALAARLATLRTCQGDTCRQWQPVPGPSPGT